MSHDTRSNGGGRHSLSNAKEDARKANEATLDGNDDKSNPLNWPARRKNTTTALVSLVAFSAMFAADTAAPGIQDMSTSIHIPITGILPSFIISAFFLGNALGPFVFAPASEIWGRKIVFHVTNILFVGFSVACALSTSVAMLICFRFLAGFVGIASVVVGSGTIADMVIQEQRGRYLAIFSTGPLIAPMVSPVIGGALTEARGWRWSLWINAIIHGGISLLCFIFLRESYAPRILSRKAKAMQKKTGNNEIHAEVITAGPTYRRFVIAFSRPIKLLILSPIVLLLAIQQAMVWGYRFLFVTTIPLIFRQYYNFGPTASGLSFLGLAIGSFVGLHIISIISDSLVKRHKRASNEASPEIRLIPMIFGSFLVPVGIFWYGWSVHATAPWIVPILGTTFFAFGSVGTIFPSTLYMVDAFTEHAASGQASLTFFRSLVAGFLPLAGNPVNNAFGVGWGSSLLAFIALALCVCPIVFYRYGEALRNKFPVKL